MKPLDNHLIVEVGARFTTTAVEGKPTLLLPAGSDDWAALTADLKAGTSANIEATSPIVQEPVRQGRVLAVPEHLTEAMTLCAGPWTKQIDRKKVIQGKGRDAQGKRKPVTLVNDGYTDAPVMRTCADITERVAVGDTIHFDPTCLTDDTELEPGVYLVPYANVICRIFHDDAWLFQPTRLHPVGGYVLLWQVWASDVEDAVVEGAKTKVRYGGDGLIAEKNVPPLANEGVVAWLGHNLRNTTDKLSLCDHVVFQPGTARLETIAGKQYLAVHQDDILLVREAKQVESEILVKRGSDLAMAAG